MNIVVLDGGTLNPGDLSWEALKDFGKVIVYNQSSVDEIVSKAQHSEIIIVNKVVLTTEVLQQLPRLKYVAVTATGYNNVDVAYCHSKNILVSNIKNYGSSTVAQHVFALLLTLTNQAKQHHDLVNQGIWLQKNAFSFWEAPLVELAGKTIGIIGWGNIGRKVAKIAHGFEMNVLFHSKTVNSDDAAKWSSLNDLIAASDVITLHTHLSEENFQIVNRSFLNKMKPSAYLINTSRGNLVNELDLAEALKCKRIAGAGLDVLSQEPPPLNHPLFHLRNCIITPHNAWASVEARQRMMEILYSNIESYLNGSPKNLISE
jgi:glycerate dehydrogenase